MSDQAFAPSNGTDGIDLSLLEKRLEGLRDTQESVQGLSLWCQSNKQHSNAITDTWLRVLRKSPVEKRLTLFYLANDVVQHAKRKSDSTVVNQWAFAVQKATPHVRSPSSVSSAITRIFKLWEERAVYSKEAIADLLSLLHNVSAKEKVERRKPETYTANSEKVAAFHPSTLISKCKLAARLKSHLGTTFRTKSYCQMGMDTLKNSIKDRQHGQEVIQEMGALLEQLRTSEQKLQAEVDERRKIVETAEVAIVFYENVRSESEIVNSAYKSFTARIMKAKDAVDSKLQSFEDMEREPSPCPSPPAAAPSPPEDDEYVSHKAAVVQSSHDSGFNNVENLQPSCILSLDSGMSSLQDGRNLSNLTPTPIPVVAGANPITNSAITTTNPVHPHMAYNNPHQMQPVSGFDSSHLGLQQQQQSWPPPVNENFGGLMMMNFQQNKQQNNNTPIPPQAPALQNFTLTPSMQLQMQMQQQHIQQFGYPSNTPVKFNEQAADIGSIPLPPQNSLSKPPLPPSQQQQQEMMFQSYHPPLPPKHDPPLPEMYQPNKPPPPGDGPLYPPQQQQTSSQSGENIYQSHHHRHHQPQDDNNMYQSHNPENMYQPVRNVVPPAENIPVYQQQQQSDENLNHEFQQQSSQSQSQEQYEPGEPPGHSYEYEPTFVDNQNQQEFERQKHHYTPTGYHHSYNPSPRTNRGRPGGGPRLSTPRHIQPLTSPTSHRPRFQSRTPNNTPRMLRPQLERYHNPPPSKIPSLLSPGSNIPQSRLGQPPNYENFPNFHSDPGDSNVAPPGNEHDFQFEPYQQQQQHHQQQHHQQQQHHPFEENTVPPSLLGMNINNPRHRGTGRGFRGGSFRGLPRMRGNGGPGPRRGRF